jgi:alpha-tubulin suppressor-like RCC1 family protein
MAYPCEVPGATAQSIACGPFHTVAVTQDGRIITWGYNKDGQLGLGHKESNEMPVEVLGLRAAAL